MSVRSYMPPPPLTNTPPNDPSDGSSRTATDRAGRRNALLNGLVLGLFGRIWMTLWLGLHPHARAPLAWAYHDEIAAAPPNDRWRRGLSFFATLPAAAAAQSDAEADDATRTGGDAPEPPPTHAGSLNIVGALGGLVALVAGVFFALLAVVTWIAVFGEMSDITDRRSATSGDEIAALGLMLLIASAPVTLFLLRRRFAWRPVRSSDGDNDNTQSLATTLGWVVVLIVFAVIAFAGWLGVTLENIDRLDTRTRHGFDDTLGLTIMAVITSTPLAALVWRRHWRGASAAAERDPA